MAEPLDMSKAIGRVEAQPDGKLLVFPTDYFETYIADLVEEINDLTARVEALESP